MRLLKFLASLLVAVVVVLRPNVVAAQQSTEAEPSADERLRQLESAEQRIGQFDSKYSSDLEPLLGSKNPYERRMALARYLAFPALFPERALPVLIGLLDDSEKIFSEDCVRLLARDGTKRLIGQGEMAEIGACRQYQKADNSQDARRLLDLLAGRLDAETLAESFAKRVALSPQSALKFVPIMPRLGRTIPASLVAALGKAEDPTIQSAFLELMMGFPPFTYPPPELLPRLDTLMQTTATLVQQRSAVVALIVTWERSGPDSDALKKAATSLLEKGLHDMNRTGLAADLVRAGRAATPLLSSLTARLSHKDVADAEAILATIGAIGEDARKATGAIVSHVGQYPQSLQYGVNALSKVNAKLSAAQKQVLRRAYNRGCREADDFVKSMKNGFAAEHPAMDDVYANYPEECRVAREQLVELKAL